MSGATVTALHEVAAVEAFAGSRRLFTALLGWLAGEQAAGLTHAELEVRVAEDGRALLRQLLQDHLDQRAANETRLSAVTDASGVARGGVETGHRRTLTTVFGEVVVERLAYRRCGEANLHPADAQLNLPVERHSHGLRRLAAIEAARGSYDETVEAIARATGQQLGKRQVEQLAQRAAVDFADFYTVRLRPVAEPDDVLVLSCDGKGVVMRADALRPATAKAAKTSETKLKGRLSKGEKRNRKRMAEVGAVYDAAPAPRTPADVMARSDPDQQRSPAPVARNKWLTASVTDDAATVVTQIFDEADRRDPDHTRTWVALVDGNNHQIDRITTEASERGVNVTIVIDLLHVLEYLWAATWSFHDEGDPAAETWVHTQAAAVLNGDARKIATSIRRKATRDRLDKTRRINADNCARYLTNKAAHLDYPTALAAGWPIATGVIEGACRHLVKDRMDITGARWSLGGAEAVLKLRALHANGDLHDYWRYHLTRERARVHQSRYADHLIPTAA